MIKPATKKIIKIGALAVGGLIIVSGVVLGVTGYWPIALVDGTSITYASFRNNFVMADHFYRSNIRITGGDDGIILTGEVQRDLQRVTMEGMIENILIEHELAKKYTASDLKQVLDNKIGGIDLSAEDTKKGMELVYGLTPDQFKEMVLVPKAKQEILEGNLTLQNGTFNDWLSAKKAEVGVSIFIPSLYWDKNEVKLK